MSGPARVTLIGKPGCHLCDEARAVVARVCEQVGVAWEEVSILDDPSLADRFADLIPVTLVDGAEFSAWRVDEGALTRALTSG